MQFSIRLRSRPLPRFVGSIFSFIEVRDKFLFALLFCIDQNWLLQPFLTELVVYLWKEQPRHEVPPTFRRVLSSRLRRLAAQGKLSKLLNFYKPPDGSETTTRTTPAPTPKPKETNVKSRQSYINQPPSVSQEMIDEAAITAACKVVEAENKLNVAKAAVEELEKTTKLADETELSVMHRNMWPWNI
ncbi:hypothetical protein F2Q70_00014713 [Brassica cretica]|uniref:H15 domain-containing protein n=1 Tax=Brassica cretica TaxID=69181 RepID=A0A3N6SJF2_BRACR|nr:hypothetical protein F2Q70_00014713 [Brassica cretica]KAF3545461.1 hypothetical protein DY000_02003098 [Brassica cretica]